MLPDTISIRSGQTATVAGTQMDTAQAQESSLDPRLLAGYPKVTDLAATGATAVFSANKPVTIYWSTSYALDGAISGSDLIAPSLDNARILSSGNVSAAAAETEVTAALNGLAADVSYILSAVAVDSRGVRSPVKTLTFTTPDNTMPAFNSGYPTVSQLTDSYAQVTVMPNKTCTLYYALYYSGVTAPTAVQLRAGRSSLTGSLRSGSMGVTKNTFDYPEFSDLSSGTAYTLFLCLSDGSRTSAVQTVAITTPEDATPEFNIRPAVTANDETSLTLMANVSKSGSIYWAAVPAGSIFPKAPDDDFLDSIADPDVREERRLLSLCSQIIGGSDPSVSHGNVPVSADTDRAFQVAGLEAGRSYDVYFVAADKADNYSEIQSVLNKSTVAAPDPSVKLSASSLSLDHGKGAALTATVANLNGSYSIVWESNTQAVTISPAYGATVTVTNTNSGEETVPAVVTATVVQGSAPMSGADGTTLSATCSVTAAPPVRTPTLALNKTSLNLNRGDNSTINATVRYLTGDYTVVWQSSNPDIHVSAFGETATVTGVAAGTAVITATVLQSSAPVPGLTATCSVIVTE